VISNKLTFPIILILITKFLQNNKNPFMLKNKYNFILNVPYNIDTFVRKNNQNQNQI